MADLPPERPIQVMVRDLQTGEEREFFLTRPHLTAIHRALRNATRVPIFIADRFYFQGPTRLLRRRPPRHG